MHKTAFVIVAAFALAGCASTSDRASLQRSSVAYAATPQPVVRQAQPIRSGSSQAAEADSSVAMLRPGATYVASFPEADRRAACERLEYREGTDAFAKCLIGDFPENPYFAQAGN